MRASPSESQAAMAAALLDPMAPAPGGRRFAVYRNNVVAGLAAQLGESFPVVRRLVGETFFRAAAAEFVRAHPPLSPVLIEWGDAFPGWIEAFTPAEGVSYLGDVARLEWARVEAYHAADAAPLAVDALAGAMVETLAEMPLRPHPSVRLVVSRFPVVSIWRGASEVDLAQLEAALVWRCGDRVLVEAAAPGRATFVAALLAGETLGAIAEKSASGALDLTAELPAVLGAGLLAAPS